jgi:phage protein U
MATPMIGELELQAVQWIRNEIEQDFARQRVPGLEGTLHQKLGRRSHRVFLRGLLLPESATDDLEDLQEKAAAGDEISFTADITSALEIENVVIESFHAEQRVGAAGQIAYTLVLAESPPLPPPAEVSAFGGLDGFGLGDLGFDPGALGDVLGDIADQAGALGDLADAALAAVGQLEALAALGNLADQGNPVKPLADEVGALGDLGSDLAGIQQGASEL